MFPMALSALRPTARQRRESGAKGCDHSGTFRPRNRALDYVLFTQAVRYISDLWHLGGAPPTRRLSGRGERPDQPLVRSMSHRIAMPRPHAPAHRGTDPPGVSHAKCSISKNGNGHRVKGGVSGPTNPQPYLNPKPVAPIHRPSHRFIPMGYPVLVTITPGQFFQFRKTANNGSHSDTTGILP